MTNIINYLPSKEYAITNMMRSKIDRSIIMLQEVCKDKHNKISSFNRMHHVKCNKNMIHEQKNNTNQMLTNETQHQSNIDKSLVAIQHPSKTLKMHSPNVVLGENRDNNHHYCATA